MLWMLVILCLPKTVNSHGAVWNVFSTNTLYAWAHGQGNVSDNSGMALAYNQTLCTAIHVNSLIRSGAQFPDSQRIQKFNKFASKLSTANPTESFYKVWTDSFPEHQATMVVQKGVEELFHLGKRFAQIFFQLFDDHGDHLKFVTTTEQHSIDSARFFFGGLSDRFQNILPHKSTTNDGTLLTHKTCDKYQHLVKDGALSEEFRKFNELPAFKKNMLRPYNSRIRTNITAEDIYLMMELCAFGMIINNTHTWCDMQTDSMRTVLEFALDLQAYYTLFTGHPINKDLACPFIKDLFTALDTVIEKDKNGQTYTVGTFQFGSPETFLSTLAALGLYTDDPPLTSESMIRVRNREFRSSRLAPFSANMAVVVHKCHTDDTSEKDYMVKMYVNEKEVVIPACGETQCLYDDVRNFYSNTTGVCDIENVCQYVKSGSSVVHQIPLYLLFVLFIERIFSFSLCQ